MEFEDVSREVEWEARRVGMAFGINNVLKREDIDDNTRKSQNLDGAYKGLVRDILMTWYISGTSLTIDTHVSEGRYWMAKCRAYKSSDDKWEVTSGGSIVIRELMARGLYCLGAKNEDALSQLPPLSAHEKLELRLSLPREFWPKTWLDEEGE